MRNVHACLVCGEKYPNPNQIRDGFCSESCMLSHRSRFSLTMIGLPKKYWNCRLDNFIGCLDGITHWLASNQFMLVIASDTTGNGKTHLASAILVDQWRKNVSPKSFFVVIPDIITARYENESEIFNKCRNTNLLVLDDLGSEYCTDYHKSILYPIINHRYVSNSRTIITTNLGRDQLHERYGDRLASRMLSGHVVIIEGPDRRLLGTQYHHINTEEA